MDTENDRPADEPSPLTDEPDCHSPDDEETEAAARRWRAYQRDRTARLEVYTEAAKALLAARGFPVLGGGDTALAASNQEHLDRTIQRECKRTLLAILDDMRRIALAERSRQQEDGVSQGRRSLGR